MRLRIALLIAFILLATDADAQLLRRRRSNFVPPSRASAARSIRTDFPEVEKPEPHLTKFHGCDPEGDATEEGGSDPDLNREKNRDDEADRYYPVTFGMMMSLPQPEETKKKFNRRSEWSSQTKATIAKYEGTPISIEGYLLDPHKSGAESCNCQETDEDLVDIHINLIAQPTSGKDRSVIIEPTPRTRAKHPAWTLPNLRKIDRENIRVRVSGWLMYDQEHLDANGHWRGTAWEIHPVTKIEIKRSGEWVNLDEVD